MGAKVTRRASKGEKLELGVSPHDLPAFRRPDDPDDCITCIHTGEQLTLIGITKGLQKKFNVSAVEVVKFFETSDDLGDRLIFSNGRIAELWVFLESPALGQVGFTFGSDKRIGRMVSRGEVVSDLPLVREA